jgi:hypothetical protein
MADTTQVARVYGPATQADASKEFLEREKYQPVNIYGSALASGVIATEIAVALYTAQVSGAEAQAAGFGATADRPQDRTRPGSLRPNFGDTSPFIEIASFSSSDPTPQVFNDFILTNIQEQDAEKSMIVETFGAPHVFASGRMMRMYQFAGMVKTSIRNWQEAGAVPQHTSFRVFYDQYLRASKMAARGQFARIVVDSDVYEGWVTTLNMSRDSDHENFVQFTFQFCAFDRRNAVYDAAAKAALKARFPDTENRPQSVPIAEGMLIAEQQPVNITVEPVASEVKPLSASNMEPSAAFAKLTITTKLPTVRMVVTRTPGGPGVLLKYRPLKGTKWTKLDGVNLAPGSYELGAGTSNIDDLVKLFPDATSGSVTWTLKASKEKATAQATVSFTPRDQEITAVVATIGSQSVTLKKEGGIFKGWFPTAVGDEVQTIGVKLTRGLAWDASAAAVKLGKATALKGNGADSGETPPPLTVGSTGGSGTEREIYFERGAVTSLTYTEAVRYSFMADGASIEIGVPRAASYGSLKLIPVETLQQVGAELPDGTKAAQGYLFWYRAETGNVPKYLQDGLQMPGAIAAINMHVSQPSGAVTVALRQTRIMREVRGGVTQLGIQCGAFDADSVDPLYQSAAGYAAVRFEIIITGMPGLTLPAPLRPS